MAVELQTPQVPVSAITERAPGASWVALKRGALMSLLALVSSACVAANSGQVIDGEGQGAYEATLDGAAEALSPEARAERAAEHFSREPRDERHVRACWDDIRPVAFGIGDANPARFDALLLATRCGLWLANHAAANDLIDDLLLLTNTMAEIAPERVEGPYHRGAVLGLLAQAQPLKGVSAMEGIVKDARRAIELDPTYDGAGPHRLLGALHLRAPGPPTGVGSVRRALFYLKKACEIAPEHPGNLLFLAEAHLANEDPAQAAPLIEAYDALNKDALDAAERAFWDAMRAQLKTLP